MLGAGELRMVHDGVRRFFSMGACGFLPVFSRRASCNKQEPEFLCAYTLGFCSIHVSATLLLSSLRYIIQIWYKGVVEIAAPSI